MGCTPPGGIDRARMVRLRSREGTKATTIGLDLAKHVAQAYGASASGTCAIRHMRDRYVKRTTDEWTMQSDLRPVEKK